MTSIKFFAPRRKVQRIFNRRFSLILADKDSDISPQRRRVRKGEKDYRLLTTGQRTTKFRKTVGSEQIGALRRSLVVSQYSALGTES